MNIEQRLELIKRNTEEVIGEKELMVMLESGQPLNHYIGFEISGKPHIGQCLICMQKVKDFHDAGFNVKIFLADWHTWINNKLGGDKKIIEEFGRGYFSEIFKISYKMLGGNPNDLEFVYASDFYAKKMSFWETFVEVSKNVTLSRIQRSISIMGKKEGESIDLATLMYPPMQVADIFSMDIHLAHAGMDQRKAHVVMRDVANKIKTDPVLLDGKPIKPVAIHNSLLPGLKAPAVWPLPDDFDASNMSEDLKMSKSDPSGAIFIHDDPKQIRKKIMKGFCMEREVRYNPILKWMDMIIFTREDNGITIARTEEHGGNISCRDFKDLEGKFSKGDVHPIDVKNYLADYLINLFEPARTHFEKPENKKMLDRVEEILFHVKNKKSTPVGGAHALGTYTIG
ncbi:MAG: tyrosine--tRNA ligase [Alphaproteobacteria bacterium]|nr:tyrosine--tRNA ligase [Alphaproteobacteria bacterium]MBN2780112.1 tyrosine--tRNA ligase [Alphaproteobacteria bacterium]